MAAPADQGAEGVTSSLPCRLRVMVRGTVQGVGFRPFVYRLAREMQLAGMVRNEPDGVRIEVQGRDRDELDGFLQRLRDEAPAMSAIRMVDVEEIASCTSAGFSIESSSLPGDSPPSIPPDLATCSSCRRELFDPEDRRYRYPFINCTACGPRFTITEAVPYDRPNTTMRSFQLCEACAGEYDDPLDRRFHAQPNACVACGPGFSLVDAGGNGIDVPDPLERAAAMLRDGMIVALKGIGGFHLAVDASNSAAVERLRIRKGRPRKPFAVMVRDAGLLERYCWCSMEEQQALESPAAPVVLLRKRAGAGLPEALAPGNDRLGVMLPYSPLHLLLLASSPGLLVMTSANFSEEPIITDNQEALRRLGGIADGFLMHDRPIAFPCDDSVGIVMESGFRLLRRSRGYVPLPLALACGGAAVLGAGAELKSTLCMVRGHEAFLSQHIGDLKNEPSLRHYREIATHLERLTGVHPEIVACDMHPAFCGRTSQTQGSGRQAVPVVQVQHHHAHLVSCLAEHRYEEKAIGIILDGSGYGTDGTVWGGELLVGDAAGFERFAALHPVPLPGGDAAAMRPWRAAAGYAFHAFGELPADLFRGYEWEGMLALLKTSVNTPLASSCGRLFDAVAYFAGLCDENSYEGQAAVELMSASDEGTVEPYAFGFDGQSNGVRYLAVTPLIADVVKAARLGRPAGEIGSRFHRTVVEMFVLAAREASVVSGIRTVALSGGVFQNPLLTTMMVRSLEHVGMDVLLHGCVPCNDGGISLGQAVIGREYLKKKSCALQYQEK
ncbi:carbamoyltransferase HypF [Prosthecochloris sp. CIB 2401]|uniref:carbamoyltransferase HypF n=1 Tax=Prosthecochloris sp. CIB 2401 TaxID=1868325 RepID=UPI00083B3E4A|nr:carbamoyltransferase HypF [Prosthecochloris sp. CIB 2401]